MAVVSFNKKDLRKLVGKKLSEEDLKNKVPMLGCDFERIDKEKVEYEIFPDRPDLLSIEGFARALKYFIGISKGLKNYKPRKGKIKVNLDKSVKQVRPYFVGGIIRNLDLTEEILKSLMQLQEKIHQTFGRGRKKVAIGIHDLDKVEPPFTYKAVNPEAVEFTPLQGERKMNLREIKEKHPKGKYAKIVEESDKWPIITDKNGNILSFPPVINGKMSQVTKETKNLFIDITGTDKKAINQVLNLVTTTLAERNGEIETVKINGEEKPDLEPRTIKVNLDYVKKLLDFDLTEEEFKNLIKGMGYDYSQGKVFIPPYRIDILHPIDIVEDVAIGYGYEKFEPRIPNVPGIGESNEVEESTNKVKELVIGFGFQEVKTSILTNKEKQFGRMNKETEEVVETINPLNLKYSICRKYLLPSLLDTLKQNKHRKYPQKIFEIGDVVRLDETNETKAKNVRHLSAVISDIKINYSEMASIVNSLVNNLGRKPKFKAKNNKIFIKNRSAEILIDEEKIGIIGEIHPEVLEKWSLEKPVVGFEINLEKLSTFL